MLATTRRAKIVEIVTARRSISNDQLADELGVSVETVRRDLKLLDKSGELLRVRGGAVHRKIEIIATEPDYSDRATLYASEKNEVADVALSLINNDRTIFIDIGTTAIALAHRIVETFQGTVITPSMLVAGILSESPGIEVLVPGGVVRGGDLSIAGPHARALLSSIYPDIMFLSTGGVDLEGGITDFQWIEVDVKRVVLQNSNRVYALADSSKLSVRAPYKVCALDEVTAIVTDSQVAAADLAAYADAGIDIIASPAT